MWRGSAFLSVVLPLLWVLPAHADGFAIKDLRNVGQFELSTVGDDLLRREEADRLTAMCSGCEQMTAVDILLGSSTDGTEERFRSGETKLEALEEQCRRRDDACRLARIVVGGAIGWQSIYSSGSTAVLFKDGDMLTIRGIGGSAKDIEKMVKDAVKNVAPQIVGN